MRSRFLGVLAIGWLVGVGLTSNPAWGQGEWPPQPASPAAELPVASAADAMALQDAQRWGDASAAWQAIVESDPENGEAVFNLGYCLHMAGRLDEALGYHARAARFEEYQGLALYNIACVHALQGSADASLEALTAARMTGFNIGLAASDSDFDSLRDDGRFQGLVNGTPRKQGFFAKVQQFAGQARTLYDIYAPEAKRNLDAMRVTAEAQAQALMGKVMRNERLGPIAARVMQLAQGGETAQVPSQQQASGRDVVIQGVSLRDAQQMQQAERWGPAADAYASVLESEPQNVAAAFGHAYCLHMHGDYEAAIVAHKRASAFPQVKGLALYNLGCAYALTGDLDGAFEALDAAVQAGFAIETYLDTDADLKALRKDPRFEVLRIRADGGL